MGAKGCYIGTPNGIVLCVSQCGRGTIRGNLYHGYSREGFPFYGYEDVIKIAERFFNELGFPYMENSDRDICGCIHRIGRRGDMARVMSDETLLEQHGDMGTFVIRVQHRQHSSWQGRVTYLDKDQTVSFRSALELLKIIDGVLEKDRKTDGGKPDGNIEEEKG